MNKARISIACIVLLNVLLACGSEQEASLQPAITEAPPTVSVGAFAPMGPHQPVPAKRSNNQKAQIEDPVLRAAFIAARQAEVAKDPGYAFADASRYSTTLRAIGDSRIVTHRAISKAKNMQAELVDDGAVRLSPDGRADEVAEQAFELKFERWGYEGSLSEAPAISNRASSDNRIELTRGSITEWYVNGPLGLEQGFTIDEPQQGAKGKQFVLELTVQGAQPKLDADGKSVRFFRTEGMSIGGYSDLFVKDAKGQQVAASLEVADGKIRIAVETQNAAFPIVVDPVVWVGTELVPNREVTEPTSVAMYGDIAVVGMPWESENGEASGFAYVFSRGIDDSWIQQTKLLPDDGAANDLFGYSVAIDDGIIVIGAPGDGDDAGSAYVFLEYAGWNYWFQQQKLTPANGSAGGQFGASVVMSNDTIVVGAPGSSPGSAYVFSRSSSWVEQQRLFPPGDDIADQFGASVAISDSGILVGSFGFAYAFTRSGTTWAQQQRLAPAPTDSFVPAVALSGDTAIVGARGPNHSGDTSGSAYIFVRAAGTWVLQQKLADLNDLQRFGAMVALSGDTALVVAPPKSVFAQTTTRIFQRSEGSWILQDDLAPPNSSDGTFNPFRAAAALSGDTAIVVSRIFTSVHTRSGFSWSQKQNLSLTEDDGFGYSVALSGDTTIVGAPGYNSDDFGAAYAFVRSEDSWDQQKLLLQDSTPPTFFGRSSALDGDTAIVGASDAAYAFARSEGSWAQQQKLLRSDPESNNGFGASVALHGNTAIIGAPTDADNGDFSGSAYVFRF